MSSRWRDEVPGTRWFRADLHIHTLDDPPRRPPEDLAAGDRTDPAYLRDYARRVLDAAVEQGIEVLGLTPHSAEIQAGVSAALTIREVWRSDYQHRIFAVYPGFEPNFLDGPKGLHLLFLFDPGVDSGTYARAFHAIMKGRSAYESHNLVRTPCDPKEAFAVLDDAVGRDGFVVVAAHPSQPNGLLTRTPDGIVDLVADRVLALELRRDRTLSEESQTQPKLRHAHQKGRSFLHTSDANDVPKPGAKPGDRELGYRFTLLKLAAPTLGALRQALLARDSRVRLPFVRDGEELIISPDLPEPCPVDRPWIREVEVDGEASFHRGQTFRFSPDLTCIIGGSMTGKSTLLDGLRVHLRGDAELARLGRSDGTRDIARGVRDRAARLVPGATRLEVESPALDQTLPVARRFAVRFFAQGELKSLSQDDDGIEHLLFHLIPGRATDLLAQRERLQQLDEQLGRLAVGWAQLHDKVAEAEQESKRTGEAREAMERFTQAGASALPAAQQDHARSARFVDEVSSVRLRLEELEATVSALAPPALASGVLAESADTEPRVADLLRDVMDGLTRSSEAAKALVERSEQLRGGARREMEALTRRVQEALVAAGGSASDLQRFDSFAKAAQHYDSFEAARKAAVVRRNDATREFRQALEDRDALVSEHRASIEVIAAEVSERFEGRVDIRILPEGRRDGVGAWIAGLKNAGLTRWWNSGAALTCGVIRLRQVADAVKKEDREGAREICRACGMSDTVAQSFVDLLANPSVRASLQALRAPDRYQVSWVEDGTPKRLDDLSGGRKVAVLLSLLLESDDPTPLVIDQPEDELDNRVVNETLIPALHRLKGRRQVIFATHNANLVVNGDADQVIVLEADANHGRVQVSGAIEDPRVRDAILRTLDGGEDAFRLRRIKYGF